MRAEERPREVRQADAPEGHGFDDLAKGLAGGTISRGRVLKLAGSAIVGAVVAVRQLSRMVLAQEGCTTCARGSDAGLCPTINPDKPFQPCCTDTSTLTAPGPQVPSNCTCFRSLEQSETGKLRAEGSCLPADQSCRGLQKCSRRDRRCPSGTVCVFGSCCNTPAEFNRDIGVCARRGPCEPISDGLRTSRSSGTGPTLTRPA